MGLEFKVYYECSSVVEGGKVGVNLKTHKPFIPFLLLISFSLFTEPMIFCVRAHFTPIWGLGIIGVNVSEGSDAWSIVDIGWCAIS